MIRGKARSMGLGSVELVSLADARESAGKALALVRRGQDPLSQKPAVRSKTFDECAREFFEAKRPEWTNARHIEQWSSSLRDYASPLIGKVPVAQIGLDEIEAVLRPIWTEKNETASRVRGRIERILDFAKVKGWRTGENPALWRGHLDKIFPAPSKVQRIEHHPALPYEKLPLFMEGLRGLEGLPARALEFTILTASRRGEVLGARWAEIDLQSRVWTVPAERMKAGALHRVPLTAAAIEALPPGDPPFPIARNAMAKVLISLAPEFTIHGFRATFKTWATETQRAEWMVVEAALAHTVGDKTQQAYQRGDLFDKRRALMEEWAEFCGR